jgi:hypothetical protein
MASNESADDPMLTVVLNGQAVIEYDRRKSPASRQRLFLDHMDRDMGSGFNLDGRREVSPDLLTRARFVAASLAQALEASNAAPWRRTASVWPCGSRGSSRRGRAERTI